MDIKVGDTVELVDVDKWATKSDWGYSNGDKCQVIDVTTNGMYRIVKDGLKPIYQYPKSFRLLQGVSAMTEIKEGDWVRIKDIPEDEWDRGPGISKYMSKFFGRVVKVSDINVRALVVRAEDFWWLTEWVELVKTDTSTVSSRTGRKVKKPDYPPEVWQPSIDTLDRDMIMGFVRSMSKGER